MKNIGNINMGVVCKVRGLGLTVIFNKEEILDACKKQYEKDYEIKNSSLNVSKTGRVSVTLRMKSK